MSSIELTGFDNILKEEEPKPQEAEAASAVETEAAETEPAAEAPQKFRKEIDLGDGSGVQVFEADTAEELIEKLTKAQAHATRKIRELNQKLKQQKSAEKPAEEPAAPTRVITATELQQLVEEWSTNPITAFEKVFKLTTGMHPIDVVERAKRIDEVTEALAARQAAEQFVVEHENDYLPTVRNYRLMTQYLQENELPVTLENLERAFTDLKEQGLLEMPKSEKQVSTQPARIESARPKTKPAIPPHSLSDRDSVQETEVSFEAAAEALYRNDFKTAKKLINALAARQQSRA